MKPTTESIVAANSLAVDIESAARTCAVQVCMAKAFFEADAPRRCIRSLEAARSHVSHLRRTQTALLNNIDEALASARGVPV